MKKRKLKKWVVNLIELIKTVLTVAIGASAVFYLFLMAVIQTAERLS